MSSVKRSNDDGLKAFTIISGEPKRIDCYLCDGSLKLYWAKSHKDVILHLLRTNDPELENLPLNHYPILGNGPSPYHHVMCRDESCPCTKYVVCRWCEKMKEALPKDVVKISCNGYHETLDGEGETEICDCKTPQFNGLDKMKLIQDAIDNCEGDSDYCYKLVALDVQDPIESVGAEPDKKKPAK